MAIPASVILYVNWGNGQPLSGSTYTAVTPDVPNSHTFTFNSSASLTQDNNSPWNGQYLANLASGVRNITSTVSSSTVNTTSGRVYVEAAPQSTNSSTMFQFQSTNVLNGRVRVIRTSGGDMSVEGLHANDGAYETVSLGTYPTNPFGLEIIYDFNNSTANQRLRARVWTLGNAAGSFVDAGSTGGGASTSDAFTSLSMGDSNNGTTGLYIGRIAFSNSTSEDLSSLSEGSASITKQAAAYYRMMRSR